MEQGKDSARGAKPVVSIGNDKKKNVQAEIKSVKQKHPQQKPT